MKIIAIDSSAETLSVGVRSDAGYFETTIVAGLHHSEYLMPAIDALMALADNDAPFDLVVCMRGPGSFTGLRIGMATAKGLAEGSGCPLVAVPTMEVLADGLDYLPGIVAPVIDARMRRVYTALFREGRRVSEDLDISAAELERLLAEEPRALFTGPGAHLLASATESRRGWFIDPRASASRASALLSLGEQRLRERGGEPIDLGPVYLRESEAETGRSHG